MRIAWRQLSTVLCVSPSRLCHRDPCDVVGEEPQVMSAVACLRRRRALLSKRCLISWVLCNLSLFSWPDLSVWIGRAWLLGFVSR